MTAVFVVATIIVFLTIDAIVQRSRKKQSQPALSQPVEYPVRIPDGIFFTKSHTWLNLFPSGMVRIGVDDFVGRMLEHPEIIFLKKPGDAILRGESMLVFREGDRALTIRSPLDGSISSCNENLPKNPSWLKDRLFSDGWGYALKPRRMSDMKDLLLGNETRSWIKAEFGRLRDFFARATSQGVAPAYLQDGGPPMAGIMKTMDKRVWEEFERRFLLVYPEESHFGVK